MKTYTKIIAAVAAGLACMAATSQAAVVTLDPVLGGTTLPGAVPVDTTYGALVGPLMASAFNSGAGVSGTLDSWVYSGAGAPAGVKSGLEFVYQIVNAAAPASSIEHLVLNGFGGVPVQVAVSPDGGTQAPTSASRLPLSNTITWDYTFPNQIPAGASSFLMIVYTSLTSYGTSTATVQDGSAANFVPIYAPVPEPATVAAGALMLLPFGVGVIRSLRKDRIA